MVGCPSMDASLPSGCITSIHTSARIHTCQGPQAPSGPRLSKKRWASQLKLRKMRWFNMWKELDGDRLQLTRRGFLPYAHCLSQHACPELRLFVSNVGPQLRIKIFSDRDPDPDLPWLRRRTCRFIGGAVRNQEASVVVAPQVLNLSSAGRGRAEG